MSLIFDTITRSIGRLSESACPERRDDFGLDKLITAKVILVFLLIGLFITIPDFVGSQAQCVKYSGGLCEQFGSYCDTLCNLANSYYFPGDISYGSDPNFSKKKIRFMPLLKVIFALTAFLLAAPFMHWRYKSDRSIFRPEDTLNLLEFHSNYAKDFNPAKIDRIFQQHVDGRVKVQYDYFLRCQPDAPKLTLEERCDYLFCFDRTGSSYLVGNFLIKKFMTIVSIICILITWNHLLHGEFFRMGPDFIINLLHHKYEPASIFSYYLSCDITFHLNSITSTTSECFYTRNVFINIAMLVTWFTLFGVLISAIFSFSYYYIFFGSLDQRMKYVTKIFDIHKKKVSDHIDRNPSCAVCGQPEKLPCENCKKFVFFCTYTDNKVKDALVSSTRFPSSKMYITPDTIFMTYLIEQQKFNESLHMPYNYLNKHFLKVQSRPFKVNHVAEKAAGSIVKDMASSTATESDVFDDKLVENY